MEGFLTLTILTSRIKTRAFPVYPKKPTSFKPIQVIQFDKIKMFNFASNIFFNLFCIFKSKLTKPYYFFNWKGK